MKTHVDGRDETRESRWTENHLQIHMLFSGSVRLDPQNLHQSVEHITSEGMWIHLGSGNLVLEGFVFDLQDVEDPMCLEANMSPKEVFCSPKRHPPGVTKGWSLVPSSEWSSWAP